MIGRIRKSMIICGVVAFGLTMSAVLADELVGRIKSISDDGASITVLAGEKSVDVKLTPSTEYITAKGTVAKKFDKEKFKERLTKAKNGIPAKIVHTDAVAEKVYFTPAKPKEADKEKP